MSFQVFVTDGLVGLVVIIITQPWWTTVWPLWSSRTVTC